MSIFFNFFKLSVITLFFLFGFRTYSQENKKNQIEDIFIWKMSDELKLSAAEEKQFSEIYRKLNQKKSNLQNELVQLSYELRNNPTRNLRKHLPITVSLI